MTATSQTEQVQRAFRAVRDFDLGTLEDVLAKDVEMVQVGRNRLAGEFHGRDELFGHFADIGRITEGLTMEPVTMLAGHDHVTSLNRMTIEMNGDSREFRVVHIFRFDDGRVVEMRSVPEDPYGLDLFVQ
jgi:ketosteroid isomerase-like protein